MKTDETDNFFEKYEVLAREAEVARNNLARHRNTASTQMVDDDKSVYFNIPTETTLYTSVDW